MKGFILIMMMVSTLLLTSCVTRETHLVPNNQPFGEFTGDHVNHTVTAKNLYENVTGLIIGDYNYVNLTNSSFIIQKAGYYATNGQFSFSDGANTEFHLAIGLNGVRQQDCHTERKLGTGGDVGSASFTCISYYNVSDILTLMVENVDNVNDIEIHSLNLNIRRIST